MSYLKYNIIKKEQINKGQLLSLYYLMIYEGYLEKENI